VGRGEIVAVKGFCCVLRGCLWAVVQGAWGKKIARALRALKQQDGSFRAGGAPRSFVGLLFCLFVRRRRRFLRLPAVLRRGASRRMPVITGVSCAFPAPLWVLWIDVYNFVDIFSLSCMRFRWLSTFLGALYNYYKFFVFKKYLKPCRCCCSGG
jgi:hypothetical protein